MLQVRNHLDLDYSWIHICQVVNRHVSAKSNFHFTHIIDWLNLCLDVCDSSPETFDLFWFSWDPGVDELFILFLDFILFQLIKFFFLSKLFVFKNFIEISLIQLRHYPILKFIVYELRTWRFKIIIFTQLIILIRKALLVFVLISLICWRINRRLILIFSKLILS